MNKKKLEERRVWRGSWWGNELLRLQRRRDWSRISLRVQKAWMSLFLPQQPAHPNPQTKETKLSRHRPRQHLTSLTVQLQQNPSEQSRRRLELSKRRSTQHQEQIEKVIHGREQQRHPTWHQLLCKHESIKRGIRITLLLENYHSKKTTKFDH